MLQMKKWKLFKTHQGKNGEHNSMHYSEGIIAKIVFKTTLGVSLEE